MDAAVAGPSVDTGTDTSAAIAEVEEQMSVLAGHIGRSIRDAALAIDPTLQPFGLKLLRYLERFGPTHASVVAEALVVDRSVISRQCRLLQELDLMELQDDPADGRARFLALTPEAVRRLDEGRAHSKLLVHGRLKAWSRDDLLQFAALIARLNDTGEEPVA